MFLIIILYALLAATFSLGKIILAYTTPLCLVGIRMTVAGLLLLCYQYFFAYQSFTFNRHHWLYYLQLALVSSCLPYILRYWALQYTNASHACLLYNFGPFISYVFAISFAQETLNIRKIVGLCIGFAGLLCTVSFPMTCTKTTLLPECSLLLSITCLSYGWFVMRTLIKELHYSPVMINAISMSGGGIIALVISWWFNTLHIDAYHLSEYFILLIPLIIISNLICHNVYVALLKRYSPTLLALASFLSPLFAALYGWLFMQETISWYFLFALILVSIGIATFYYEELKKSA